MGWGTAGGGRKGEGRKVLKWKKKIKTSSDIYRWPLSSVTLNCMNCTRILIKFKKNKILKSSPLSFKWIHCASLLLNHFSTENAPPHYVLVSCFFTNSLKGPGSFANPFFLLMAILVAKHFILRHSIFIYLERVWEVQDQQGGANLENYTMIFSTWPLSISVKYHQQNRQTDTQTCIHTLILIKFIYISMNCYTERNFEVSVTSLIK